MTTATLDKPARSAPTAPGVHAPAVLRQTQAMIGLVVLAGTAGAFFVNIAWAIIPAILGVGLLVAGFTGVCPMASLIARMPWNKAAVAEHLAGGSDSCCGHCG